MGRSDPVLAKACLHTSGDKQLTAPKSVYSLNIHLQLKPDSTSLTSPPPRDPRGMSPSQLNAEDANHEPQEITGGLRAACAGAQR